MSRLVALLFAACLALAGGGCTGCATALLEGVLVAGGDGGLAVRAADGTVVEVRWPDGVGVGRDGNQLVLRNPLGLVVAREGEYVSMGGGQTGNDGEFGACGPIAVKASGPPTR
jgi:hypothetical protein